jgi:hypothetical protein
LEEVETARAVAQEELDNGKDGAANLIFPKYKYD